MVNERDDKYEGQEEGEYHFSDDQVTYDVESDAVKAGAVPVGSRFAKIGHYRRPIIGVVVFLILITVIYKMITPTSTTPPPTDITQTTVATPPPATKRPIKVEPAPKTEATPAPVPMPMPMVTPVAAPVPTAQPQLPQAVPAAAPVAPQMQQPYPQAVPAAVPPQPQNVTAPATAPLPAALNQVPAPVPTPQFVPAPTAPQPQVLVAPPAATLPQQPQPPVLIQQGPAPAGTLTTIEEQTTRLVPVAQTDASQKLLEVQEQNTQLRDQLSNLNVRMVNIERNLNRLVQGLGNRAAAIEYAPRVIPRPAPVPRIAYTVSAIIPGRAWLKSESGETITVAEGDKLNGIGRVIKIDPYDGVVNIDIGGRVVTLSYGANGD